MAKHFETIFTKVDIDYYWPNFWGDISAPNNHGAERVLP